MLFAKTKLFVNSYKPWYNRIAFNLLPICLAIILLMCLIPWQQTIISTGKVSALDPNNRPQSIQAPIEGRIQKIHVQEGQYLKKGQIVLELEDLQQNFLAPNLQNLTAQQYQAQLSQQNSIQQKISILNNNFRNIAINFENQLQEQRQLNQTLKTNQEVALLNLQRQQNLYKQKLISQRELELAQRVHTQAQNTYKQGLIKLNTLESAFNLQTNNIQVQLATSQAELQTNQAKLSQTNIQQQSIQQRSQLQVIKSPINGYLTNLHKLGIGETVQPNDKIATIVPLVRDQAVELLVRDIDIPFIKVGDPVRLQFAGWPTMHFPGLSHTVNVGTFGGIVQVIDSLSNNNGKFRIIVIPDPEESKTKPWPHPYYLKAGLRATGWVILRTVPLGYELWRNFNGFPLLMNYMEAGNTPPGPQI